jgi:hypothetical protein
VGLIKKIIQTPLFCRQANMYGLIKNKSIGYLQDQPTFSATGLNNRKMCVMPHPFVLRS